MILFIFLFNLFIIVYSTDTNYAYSCEDIKEKEFFNFNSTNCKFLSNKEINCIVYFGLFEYFEHSDEQIPYLTKYFESNITYTIQDEIIEDNNICLGLKMASLKLIDLLPEHSIFHQIPASWLKGKGIVFSLFDAVKWASASLTCDGNSTVGLLNVTNCLNNNIKGNKCIENIKIITQLLGPDKENFRDKFPKLDEKSDVMYYEVFKARVTHITLALNVKSDYSWLWMKALEEHEPFIQLEYLDGSGSHFTKLTYGRVGKHPKLSIFKAHNSYIKLISNDSFLTIPNIQELDLSSNSLSFLPNFHYLNKLHTLNISRQNNIFNIENVSSMPKLKVLYVSHNSFPYFNRSIFVNLTELEVLDASYCGLKELSEDIFQDTKLLKLLILDHNHFKILNKNIFLHLPPTAVINLKYCELITPLNLKLNHNSSLLLEGNYISKPDKLNITGIIKYMDLSNNKIVNWTKKEIFKNIVDLNLSRNLIYIINEKMSPAVEHVHRLNIENNPFDCDTCGLRYFQAWLIRFRANLTKNSSCFNPPNKRHELVILSKLNETLCEEIIDYTIVIGVPFAFITFTITFLIVVCYLFRTELKYIVHLLKIRRNTAGKSRNDDGIFLYDLFVCYCSKDRDWVVNILLPNLENDVKQYKLCLHERDFRIGAYIIDNIGNCIENSKRVMMVITPNFIQSEWCLWEVRLAQQKGIEDRGNFLIIVELVKVDRRELPIYLRTLMENRTYLEWPSQLLELDVQNSFWTRLKETLGPPVAIYNEDDEDHEDIELFDNLTLV